MIVRAIFLLALAPLCADPSINSLRYEIENHDIEIQSLQDRLSSQEGIVHSLNGEVIDSLKNQQVILKRQQAVIDRLETTVNALVTDFKNLRDFSNGLANDIAPVEEKKSSHYSVKRGDTLEKIARAHETTISKLKKYNRLQNDKIRIGQKLQIP